MRSLLLEDPVRKWNRSDPLIDLSFSKVLEELCNDVGMHFVRTRSYYLKELSEFDFTRAIVIDLLNDLLHLFHRVDKAEANQRYLDLINAD